MWIERLELTGFGALQDTRIDFSKDKLNLVVDVNEYGKSTIADAIWAILYDFPSNQKTTDDKLKDRDARRPASGNQYKACIDIVCGDRKLRAVRDFEERTLRVFDRGAGDVEVTKEFLSGANQDDLGVKLTALSRDLFRNTCFIGQGALNKNSLDSDKDISSLLQTIADASGDATTSDTAIAVLEDTLSHFSFRGRKAKLERFISEQEEEREKNLQELNRLKEQRTGMAEQIERVAELESKMEKHGEQEAANEYFQLCLQIADMDSRLCSLQDRLERLEDLEFKHSELKANGSFPIRELKSVEELWAKLESRCGDQQRLRKELETQEKYFQGRKQELRERWAKVAALDSGDVAALLGLSRTLETAETELSEARTKREDELKRVKDSGVELDALSTVRRSLLNLDAREVDEANACNARIKAAKEQIAETERQTWRARMIKTEIEEQRKRNVASSRTTLLTLVIVFILLAAVSGGVYFLKQTLGQGIFFVSLGLVASVGIASFVVLGMIGSARLHRQSDYAAAAEDEDRNAAQGQEQHAKIMGMEVKLEDLARKVGIGNGAELIKQLQEYSGSAAQLRDLDLLDQLISNGESQVRKIREQIDPLIIKAGPSKDSFTLADVMALSAQAGQSLEEFRSLESSASYIEAKRSELKIAGDDAHEIESALRHCFALADCRREDIKDSYNAFMDGVAAYKQYEAVTSEIERLKQDNADSLPEATNRLKEQRAIAWSRMQELLAKYPGISDTPPTAMTSGAEAAFGEDLRKQRDELSIHVRAETRDYDQNYLETEEKLDSIERELESLRHTRKALELARDKFVELSKETHVHWSARLNEISRDMLDSLALDYESINFDQDLRITARRKGQSEPLQPANIASQVSTGTREQIHWLARMAIVRFLTDDVHLPLIMDEPFSETDDQRFQRLMTFLLDVVLPRHQLIVFSCHQERHRWLSDQFDIDRKSLVKFCNLEPMVV